ncbi:galactose mutarotase [Nocardioides KLBMP 9356]|uniref:Aldose 1-epimerase n=1 Tax=Nocardioides potassii TaxID=2911371 RepID=A0ABS9H9V7_9ACTN|nr:aldose epimerase family protein [Nocardioides potassii]MCF6378002.1 galactose mutarotase [Nocardioides potassii]
MPTDRVFDQMPDGREVRLLTIGSEPGPVVEVLTLGAAVHRLLVDGRDVVLGHADVAERLASPDYVGATIGRYANRIAGGRFSLGGTTVQLAANDRGNNLHGGPEGFDVQVWDVVSHSDDAVELALVSPDGDQGFPGTVTARVRYAVSGDTVTVELSATTDATTVVGMTQHSYFNLDGEGSIDEHGLVVEADEYTPVDDTAIPLGEHAPVAGTPFDLRSPAPLRASIDHNYVVRGSGLRRHASLSSPRTGATVEVWSDQPGLQVYTGDGFDGSVHVRRAGVALEPQVFPDSPNHPEWPSPVLEPGETYRSVIEWRFARSAPVE